MIKMDFKNLTSFHEVEFLPEVAAFGKTSQINYIKKHY